MRDCQGMARAGITALILLFVLAVTVSDVLFAGNLPRSLLMAGEGVRDLSSFSCKFVQEKRLKIFKRPITFRGRILVRRPDKLRIDFFSPIPSSLIFSGDQMVKCGRSDKVKRIDIRDSAISPIVSAQMKAWMSGDYTSLLKYFDIIENSVTGSYSFMPLTPVIKNVLNKITIEFSKDRRLLKRISVYEADGDLSTMVFDECYVNEDISEEFFEGCKVMQKPISGGVDMKELRR